MSPARNQHDLYVYTRAQIGTRRNDMKLDEMFGIEFQRVEAATGKNFPSFELEVVA